MTAMVLECRECKKRYGTEFRYVCDECFGPLDVRYEGLPRLEPGMFEGREQTYWRYRELLPVEDASNIISIGAGMTPLIKADALAERLGLRNVYIKNDSVNPTFSFKDRPAGVAVSKAKEFGMSRVGCASTGNLASATAAHAARGGMPCHIFAPSNIEMAKIAQALSYGADYISVDGTYDDANRIAAQAGDRLGIGVVNINMRSYYVEGSKTLAYEVAEQMGWRVPDNLVVPVGSGAMLNAICKGFEELESASLVPGGGGVQGMRVHAAQPTGCAPVVDAFANNQDAVVPVESPDTIAKSLAIGDPGDGRYVLKRLRQYDGTAVETSDSEIIDAILLLAKTEGIFTEPAGGVAVATLQKMAEQKMIDPGDSVVCYVTGNGLKATEAVMRSLKKPETVKADAQAIIAEVAGR